MAKWARKPDVSVALCGGYRDLLAIDVDSDDPRIKAAVLDALPHCRIARFGSKGFALMVRSFKSERIPAVYSRDQPARNPLSSSRATGQHPRATKPAQENGTALGVVDPETGEEIDGLPPLTELPIVTPDHIRTCQESPSPRSHAPHGSAPAGPSVAAVPR